jgi:hypothetical protein
VPGADNRDVGQSREQFPNTQAQLVSAGFFAFIAILGLLMTSHGDAIAGWIFAGVGLGLVVRAFCSCDVVVDQNEVRMRSLVFTRRFALKDITSADVEVGRTGMNGFDREYLVLHRVVGADVAFKELNSAPSTSSVAVTTVQQAAHAINERIGNPAKPGHP